MIISPPSEPLEVEHKWEVCPWTRNKVRRSEEVCLQYISAGFKYCEKCRRGKLLKEGENGKTDSK